MSTVALPPPAGGAPDVLIIAGEHSGDEHGAVMVRDFLAAEPGAVVCALGGPALAGAGAQLLSDLTASSVVGIAEVVRNLRFFRELHEAILGWVATYRPKAVCFIDYPGLNLRLAEALRRRGLSRKGGGTIRTLFYISPQIWAWKGERRFTMARDLDAMAVIFPFEVDSYADTHLPVEFVGHPFVARGYLPPVMHDPAGPVLLLPGSRKQAVGRIFPALVAGHRAFGERPAVVLYPSEAIRAVLEPLVEGTSGIRLQRTPDRVAGEPPVAASAVLTSSGTMSMHCALAAIPGAIAYRANPVTYLLGRMLVHVPYLGIANLLLGQPMYPEFIQGAATPAALAEQLRAGVHDPRRQARTTELAQRLRSILAVPAARTAGLWLHRQLD